MVLHLLTTAAPAFSMSRRLGIFRSSMAARSSARISAAVTSSMSPDEVFHFAHRPVEPNEDRPGDDAVAMLYSTISVIVRKRRTFW